MIFRDRSDAGRQLAARLRPWSGRHAVVLALPRGGVEVAFEIARVVHASLDLLLVRKIGAPRQPELALGAVADGGHPELVVDEQLVETLGVTPEYLTDAKAAALAELERRRSLYLGDRPAVPVRGRAVIVVDDGIATGATMLAALRAIRERHPAHLVVAVPVAPRETIERLRAVADEITCLHTPAEFVAVGQFYRAFPQLSDEQVVALLDQSTGFAPAAATDSAAGGPSP
jgi:putative phosphoribosyl transferase